MSSICGKSIRRLGWQIWRRTASGPLKTAWPLLRLLIPLLEVSLGDK